MAETTHPPGSPGSEQPPVNWAEAFARHQRWLRTVVLARLGEPQARDEVMQEIALAAVKQQVPVRDPGRLGAWLYRVAIRQVLLYRRKHGRHRKLLAGFRENGQGNESVTDPLNWLLLDERKTLVRKSLAHLPGRDAEILLLKYTEDWSYRELAAHLGLSESAVEARLHRARQRLREAIISANVIEVSE
ncbi:MAG TPA: sigma-70 family RNA polymerase sigma factor [Gemmataceae bacterium]|nr:sigma-70 family RNA polymerase sigma factor [Gemmataceae bacterium]